MLHGQQNIKIHVGCHWTGSYSIWYKNINLKSDEKVPVLLESDKSDEHSQKSIVYESGNSKTKR